MVVTAADLARNKGSSGPALTTSLSVLPDGFFDDKTMEAKIKGLPSQKELEDERMKY